MKDERTKDESRAHLPSTVPERRRDVHPSANPGTMVVASAGPTRRTPSSPDLSEVPAGASSYQPPKPSETQREVIVASGASIASMVNEIRRPPAERLDIEGRAAQGGMGAIDVAVDRALDRRIALKTLHPHLHGEESAVRMFLREARLTGLLEHPHIVPIYDIGEREGRLYFAMKLVEGQTLADVIRALPRAGQAARTPLDTATLYELLDIVTKVCDALAFAHSKGVLHCDIKPANVMVGEFGQVYLMDWGIARIMATDAPGSIPNPDGLARPASATDNSVIGTPCYMSPEQARGDRAKLDARSDVFLLGGMLYEILTRRPPYASPDRSETLSLAIAGAFPAPRKVAGEAAVPLELDRIVMRAMAKSADARYPTVSALRDDLVQFMRGGAEFPRRTFAAGEVIVREGEPGDAAYIVVAGECEVRKEMPGGEQTLRTLAPGDVFGEMAILSEGPRTATIVALTETTVLVVTSASLDKEMAAMKPWIATLVKSLAARFRDIDTRNRATFAASPSPARLANQVLMHVMTWGEGAGASRSMKWSVLSIEIELQLGLPPIAIFGAIARYGMQLDTEADRLTIPDVPALTARLRAELR